MSEVNTDLFFRIAGLVQKGISRGFITGRSRGRGEIE